MHPRWLAVLVVAWTLPATAQSAPAATPPQPSSRQEPAPASPSTAGGDLSAADVAKLDLTPDANGKLSQPQIQQLFRVVADKDLENQKRQRDYTYTEREVDKKLDGHGEVKSTESRTYDIMDIDGEPVYRLVKKDDKPLDAKDAAKEDEKIQKIIDKRKNESDDDRRKRLEKEEKEREDNRKFVLEVADAYNFTLLGTEAVDGRDAWVIAGEPRPGFEPHMKEAKFLSKFHGRVWIDKADLQLSKLDVEAIDTVSIGLFLARIHKGTRVMLEQTRVNDEVWLPRHLTFNVDLRLALVKGYKVDGDQTYSDYKKFRTSAKIVGYGEVKEK
ncbi:MAG TPA: hypothetical protein VMG31_07970 [Verrucomicrobiae bacterium]|nr:hypothetical protein [Verrucomicrobiae bacterium]